MSERVAPDDPRLDDYRALNQPDTRRRVEREGGYFVVEGPLAIERLLGLGPAAWRTRSLLLLPKLAERLGHLLDAWPAAAERPPVLVGDEALLRSVVGFDLHRGALAAVDRTPARPAADVVRVAGDGALLVAAEGVNDHENLGALYRNAAAFGAAGVLLDPTSADPFYRRSIRVSSGHVLAVPTGALGPVPGGLHELAEAGATILALTPDERAVPLTALTAVGRPAGPTVVLVGAEGPGLTAEARAAAAHEVRIEMAGGIDSLNVATAAAIALHHLRAI